MNAAKPPIYRSRDKSGGHYEAKVIGEKKAFGALKRNLSIPNVNVSNNRKELGVPGVLERSNSLSSLSNVIEAKLSTKSLSASNLLALSDSNLSIQEAKPKRFYDLPANNWAKQKSEYVAHAHMYFHQLTEGCGKEECRNLFCKSCQSNVMERFLHESNIAAVLSMELAKSRHKHLCKACRNRGKVFPEEILMDNEGNLPFLCSVSKMSPFKNLFQQSPLISSRFSDEIVVSHRSVSQGDVRLSTINKKPSKDDFICSVSHLAGALSSGISSFLGFPQGPKIMLPGATFDEHDNGNSNGSYARKTCTSQSKGVFGSENYISDDLDELKDFENAVASEITNSPYPTSTNEFSLTHLTLEMVDHILEDFLECGDSSFILNTFRTVFSSSESLNLSFIDNNMHYASEINDKEVDLAELRLSFEKIQSCDNGSFMSTILDSVRVLCSELSNDSKSIEVTNQLIIILELPGFFDTELAYMLIDILKSLPPVGKRSFVKSLSKYDALGFQKNLKGFQSLLTSLVMDKVVADENIVSLCSVLGMLYEANHWPSGIAHIVADSDFFNEKLSKCLEIKKEYQHWQSIIHPESDRGTLPQTGTWSSSETSTSILQYPFLLKPDTKVHLIHFEAINEMRKEYQTAIVHQAKVQTVERVLNVAPDYSAYPRDVWSAMCPYLVLEVRRDFLVEDALEQLQKKMRDLKKPLKIKYIGGGEQGLDMGGLQKEFFQLGVEKLFNPAYGMFIRCGETRSVWFNPQSLECDAVFELTGMILGLAIYNGIILDVPLAGAMYSKLRGRKPTLQDLWDIEPTVARSLKDLLDYDGSVEEDLCLDFQVVESYLDSMKVIDLLPGGQNITVTRKNRQLYVDLYVHYLLSEKVAKQFESFSFGFTKVCNGDAIKLFRPDELELLICGSPEIDFSQLEKVTTYVDGFTADHPLIKQFWLVVDSFSHEQKKRLLSFVTGSDRVPLAGLTSISFIIQRNGPDTENLPTSMTCFNRLLLPEYNIDKLKGKLLIAIENSKGFGLT